MGQGGQGHIRTHARERKRCQTGSEFEFLLFGGAERDRTVDLLNAIQALSQLSYGPTRERSFNKGSGACQRF